MPKKKKKSAKGGGDGDDVPKRKLTPLDYVKILIFIPFFGPRWLYNKCERDGKLVLLSGVCALALGGILAFLVVGAGWGEMSDISGAVGCVGAGVVLIAAHYA